MSSGDQSLTLRIRTRGNTPQTELDRAASQLFALFQTREAGFGVAPGVVVDTPDIAALGHHAFLSHPAAYADRRVALLNRDGPAISRIVILTTFGDRLFEPLSAAGYRGTWIDMPAGPDGTAWFERGQAGSGRILYVEAVDEADEKIRPSFVLDLRDYRGRLRGGGCGAIHERGGARFCYLATMTLDTGLPAGTGTDLGQALIGFLRAEGVVAVHLGTQTAGRFYERLGFRVTHRLVQGLRTRRGADGSLTRCDLVMMEGRP